MTRRPRAAPTCRQRGLALLLVVLALLSVSGVLTLMALSGAQASASDVADRRLAQARDALLGYAVGVVTPNGRLGQLPAPDILLNGYDGKADHLACLDAAVPDGVHTIPSTALGENFRCLGRLPWKDLGLDSLAGGATDATGEIPWYAVSANLASSSNSCLDRLNPATLAAQPPVPGTFACGSTPPFPWLKVCDGNGRIISDRVAFVVIAPGRPISTAGRVQSRGTTPRARDFLDGIAPPAGWADLPPSQRCSVLDNAALGNEFVAAPSGDEFNDRLVFVTVDELSVRMEARAALEAARAIEKHRADAGAYPWMAPATDPAAADAHLAVNGMLAGLLPFHAASPGYRFRTEMSWQIAVNGQDTFLPASSSSPTFPCYGGTFTCRLRLPAGNPIPRTITAAEFDAFKARAISTPDVSCSFSTLNALNCDSYVIRESQAATYLVERRPIPAGGNPFVAVGQYAGTRTRTVTATLGGITSAGSVQPGTGGFSRRAHTQKLPLIGLLVAEDHWMPDAPGPVPFDQVAPLKTGSAETDGMGVVSVGEVRVYPILPAWYQQQGWHAFMFAAVSPDAAPPAAPDACAGNCLQAGRRGGLRAVVVSAGPPLPGQLRQGTSALKDFLEAPNLDAAVTRQYADPATPRTGQYADTLVTIPR